MTPSAKVLAAEQAAARPIDVAAPATAPTPAPLAPGVQLARDARLRLVAAACVVLVHAAYQPAHPAVASLPGPARVAASLAFSVVVSFPVNAFVLLSFLGLAARLQAGVPAVRLLAPAARRLLPAQLFWASAFLAVKAVHDHAWPSPRAVVEGIVLGAAAAHLYFIPLLLALTAAAPLLWRVAARPAAAAAGCVVLAAASVALDRWLGPEASRWLRMVVGLLGLAPFALAALALARAWRGVAPAGPAARRVALAGAALAGASALVLAALVLRAGPGGPPPSAARWAANLACALGIPLVVLALPGRVSPRLLRLAPLTLGVYLMHPFPVMALRAAEAHVGALARAPAALVIPNAVVALVVSAVVVQLLARSRLRRVVL